MRLNDRQIEAFRATVVLGSVTAAAEALHVTQPAISRLLKDLEADVGFALIERAGRGVRPTRRGRLLFEEVERAHIGLSTVRERAELIRSGQIGHLRIAVMPAFAETFVAPAVGALLAESPELGVELDVLNTGAIVDGVRRRRFDFGIAAPVLTDPALTWEVLRSAQMVAVMRPDHPLSGGDPVSAADLARHGVIALPTDSPYRLQLQAALARSGQHAPRIVGTVRTQAAACEMLAAGCRSLALVDPSIADRHRGHLVARPLAFELRSDLALCRARDEDPGFGEDVRRHLKVRIAEAARTLTEPFEGSG